MTFAYIEREVTSILADREKSKTSKVAAEISHDSKNPIAFVATFYTQKKKFQSRGGKFTAGQSRLPISKPANGKYIIPKSAWQAMSEEDRQDALKVMRAFHENRVSSSFSRGCGGRSRGNRTA